jgi:hypothetical protein
MIAVPAMIAASENKQRIFDDGAIGARAHPRSSRSIGFARHGKLRGRAFKRRAPCANNSLWPSRLIPGCPPDFDSIDRKIGKKSEDVDPGVPT